jgi:RNA 3'-terminal phosphate cyclase
MLLTTTTRGSIPAGGMKRTGQVHRDHRESDRHRRRRRPRRRSVQLTMASPTSVRNEMAADQRPRLRRPASGVPSTITIDVANGMAASGKAVVVEYIRPSRGKNVPTIASMPAILPHDREPRLNPVRCNST